MALNRYDAKREVWVTPFTGSATKYGFLTNVEAEFGTFCGHNAVDRANLPAALTFGANAPKPGRASRARANGVDSSFYDIAQRGTLRTAGFSTTTPRVRRPGGSRLTRTVYVTILGVKYAWAMPNILYTRIGEDRTALGIADAANDDDDLVFGASYPKPPRARKQLLAGASVDIISTFVDPAALDDMPEGWTSSNVVERL